MRKAEQASSIAGKRNRIAVAALIHVLSACILHRTEEWSSYSLTAHSTARSIYMRQVRQGHEA